VRTGLRSRAERERFLADVHVGILHVADAASTLGVPVWYQYTPTAGVSVITSNSSRKGRAIQRAARFGLVAQIEDVPYRYVSVDGPVVESRPCVFERDLVPMAVRYLGEEAGTRYAAAWRDAGIDDTYVSIMHPERWFAVDLVAEFAALGIGPRPTTSAAQRSKDPEAP
jgi:uncharacterized protein